MKTLLLLLLTFILYGCSESRTISKGSDAFTTLEQKIGLLKKYVNLNGKNFKTLDYHIIYQDNSTGMVPGPSDWDICIIAEIPETEISVWIEGLKTLTEHPNMDGFERVSTKIDYTKINEWYHLSGSSFVGLNRKKRILVYRSHTY